MGTCNILNCDKKYYGKGYCSKHYHQIIWDNNAYAANRRKGDIKYGVCKTPECERGVYAKGYCHLHLGRLRHHGTTERTQHNNQGKTCLAEGCNMKATAKGMCSMHYTRWKVHGDYTKKLPPNFKKGSANPNWKGGVAEYPNHTFMKKQRLIILMNNPKCEMCGKPATEIHHKDGSKSNHRLENLMASCHKCNTNIRFGPTKSKYWRMFGKSIKEMSEEHGLHPCTVRYRIKQGIPLDRPKHSGKGIKKLTNKNQESIIQT